MESPNVDADILDANVEGLQLLQAEIVLNRIKLGSLRTSLRQNTDWLSGADVMRVEQKMVRAASIVERGSVFVASLPADPNQRLLYLADALEVLIRIQHGEPPCSLGHQG